MTDQEYKPQTEQPEPEDFHDQEDRDPLSAITWALILIWAGLVFLASNLGWLEIIKNNFKGSEVLSLAGINAWSIIFVGAGLLVFLEAIIRTFVPAYHASTGRNFFLAAILLGVGLGGMFGWSLIWPVILIAVGISALASALIQKRE